MVPPEPAHALIGEFVDGRYRVLRLVGRGGMGAVFEAQAERLRRRCALKVLLPEYTRNDTAVQRFQREAEVAARVDHPHVVKIFDTGTTSSGLGYIAMELLEGETLDRTIRREGRIAWPRARHMILQICRALAAAHAQHVVHRDMKPENCFRLHGDGDPDFVKVLDFGIAKLTDAESGQGPRLTATDSVIGTYAYMAFEQVRGNELDHRVDIWAVGVILYEMLTGGLPFKGQNQGQIWTAIFQDTPVPIRHLVPDAGIPEEVDAIVARALEKSRDARYPTIDALAAALASVDDGGAAIHATSAAPAPRPALRSAIDVKAETLAVASPAPVKRDTEPVSPQELTELHAAEVQPITHESARTELAPSTDPIGRTQLAPLSESQATGVHIPLEIAPMAAVAPDQALPRKWLIGSGSASAALIAAMVIFISMKGFSGDPGLASPDLEAREPIAPHSLNIPDPGPEPPPPAEAPTSPDEDEILLEPDEPPVPEPPVPEPPVPEPQVPEPQVPETPVPEPPVPIPEAQEIVAPKKPAPVLDYKTKIRRKLASLCNSKAIRTCFTKRQQSAKEMTVKLAITAATGKVRPELPDLDRGSLLAICVEREISTWKMPTGGAGQQNMNTSCTLNPRR